MDVLASLGVLLNMQADRIARVRQLQAMFVLKCTRGRQPAKCAETYNDKALISEPIALKEGSAGLSFDL